ncbi:MAG: NADH-quinone oxidoreductase subunit L, partial [Planctomycetales bacterium]|nr:NADH-quinone oxidoreductase subunit L [Planctomycetales bacterium]
LEARTVVACIGGFTALLAGLIAITQTDLKRVLAYSTISQLGYMFLALGTGSVVGIVAGMFHLFTHAFFKALLFLGAGSVMHAMGGVIDMRRFSGLRRLMPWTCGTFLIGCLALSGVYPFAGFWSKDAVLASVHEQAHHHHTFAILYYAGLFTAFLTAVYTFRAFFLTFFGSEEIPAEAGHHAHESPVAMVGPLCVLAFFATIVGFWHHPFADFLVRTPSLAIEPMRASLANLHAFHGDVAAVSTIVAFSGIAVAAFFFLGDRKEAAWLARAWPLRYCYSLSYGKFFLDHAYMLLIVLPLWAFAKLLYFADRFVVDGLVDFCGHIPVAVGRCLRTMQTGLVHYYASFMVLGFLIMAGVLLLKSMFF